MLIDKYLDETAVQQNWRKRTLRAYKQALQMFFESCGNKRLAAADTARKSSDLCGDYQDCNMAFGRFCGLLLSVSEMPAQLDIDSNHRPVHVNAIVPNAPTRLTVAFG